MPLFHNVTRGGQVHIHQLRMIRQVIWFALAVSFFTSLGYLSYKVHRVVPNWAWQTLWEYHVAELNVMSQPSSKEKSVRQMYYAPGMIPYARTSYSIVHDRAIKKLVFKIESYLIHLSWQSAKIGGKLIIYLLH